MRAVISALIFFAATCAHAAYDYNAIRVPVCDGTIAPALVNNNGLYAPCSVPWRFPTVNQVVATDQVAVISGYTTSNKLSVGWRAALGNFNNTNFASTPLPWTGLVYGTSQVVVLQTNGTVASGMTLTGVQVTALVDHAIPVVANGGNYGNAVIVASACNTGICNTPVAEYGFNWLSLHAMRPDLYGYGGGGGCPSGYVCSLEADVDEVADKLGELVTAIEGGLGGIMSLSMDDAGIILTAVLLLWAFAYCCGQVIKAVKVDE